MCRSWCNPISQEKRWILPSLAIHWFCWVRMNNNVLTMSCDFDKNASVFCPCYICSLYLCTQQIVHHRTLDSAHYKLHTTCWTLPTAKFTLHTTNSTPPSVHHTLQKAHCILDTAHCKSFLLALIHQSPYYSITKLHCTAQSSPTMNSNSVLCTILNCTAL